MRILVLFLFLLCCTQSSQSQQISQQFSVNNGLQSNEVYQIEKDKYGQLWICSDRGLASFNGNEFSHYDVSNGLSYPNVASIFKLQNTLFFSELNGGISYLDKNNSVKRHWLSDLVKPYLKTYRYIIQAVEKDNLVYLSYRKLGILVIDMKSKKVIKFIKKRTKESNFFIIEENGLFLFLDAQSSNKNTGSYFTLNIVTKKLKLKKIFKHVNGKFHLPNHLIYLINRKNGGCCLSYGSSLFEIDAKGHFYTSRLSSTLLRLQESEKNELILSSWKSGITVCDANCLFKEQKKKHLFPNTSSTSICYDNENGTWISTHGSGIYYLSPKRIRFEKLIEDNAAKNIFGIYSNNDKLYITKNYQFLGEWVNKSYLDKFHIKDKCINLLTINGKEYLISGDSSTVLNGSSRKAMIGSSCYSHLVYKNYVLLANNGSISFIDASDNHSAYLFEGCLRGKRVTSLDLLNGHLYIGTSTGLFWIENFTRYLSFRSTLRTIQPKLLDDHLLFEEAFVKDIVHKKNTLYIATIGSGLLVYNTKTKAVQKIEKKHGLFSQNIEDLELVGNKIYTVSFSGINEITLPKNRFRISKYSSSKDLKINNPFQLNYFKGYFYIVHSDGLGRLKAQSQLYIPKNTPCYISEIRTDKLHFKGLVKKYPKTLQLKKSTALIIRFKGVSFQLGRNTLYKYRIKGWSNRWILAESKVLRFPHLANGKYTLEIVALDELNNMSTQKAEVAFEIIPPFYKSNLFIVLILLSMIGGFFSFYFIRMRFLENKMKFNIINQKATVAQINPHFIFNILNSINSDILLKDPKNASKTLVNFSNLMRQNLHNSSHPLVLLQDDLDALKYYLILEQNRMENFDFDIQIKQKVDVAQLLIPPMLIQPFVENVLKHAFIEMNPLTRGKLIISIQWDEGQLSCLVTDDGVGVNRGLENKEKMPLKKSMGMSITKERLSFLSKYYGNTFKLEIIDNNESGSRGTSVCFYLPFKRT